MTSVFGPFCVTVCESADLCLHCRTADRSVYQVMVKHASCTIGDKRMINYLMSVIVYKGEAGRLDFW